MKRYKIHKDRAWDRPWRIYDNQQHRSFGGWTSGENAILYLINYKKVSIMDIDTTEVY